MKRSRDDGLTGNDDSQPLLSASPVTTQILFSDATTMSESPLDHPTAEEWAVLRLPKVMKQYTHRIHLLDRQYRAALYDAVRVTEVCVLISRAPDKRDGSIDLSSLPQQLAASLIAAVGVVDPTRSEVLATLHRRAKECDAAVLQFAVDKERVAKELVLVVARCRAAIRGEVKGGGGA